MSRPHVMAVYDGRSFCDTVRSSSAVIDRRYRKTLVVAAALALTACSICGLNHDLGLIKPGMKTSEVEALLGRPARIDQTETADQTVSGEVYHYSTPSGEGRVIFINGVVFKSEILDGAKS